MKVANLNIGYIRRGIPNSLRVKMKFSDIVNVTGTSGAVQSYRINGPYDPDLTGAGVQPVGYDEWSALYARYQAFGSKIKITATNNQAVPVTVACYPTYDPVAVTSVEDAMSQPNAKWVFLGGSGAQNRGTIVLHVPDVRKFLSLDSWISTLFSQTNTNPSTQAYYTLWINNFAGTTMDLYLDVEIIYDTKFFYAEALDLSAFSKYVLKDGVKHYLNPDLQKKYLDRNFESEDTMNEEKLNSLDHFPMLKSCDHCDHSVKSGSDLKL